MNRRKFCKSMFGAAISFCIPIKIVKENSYLPWDYKNKIDSMDALAHLEDSIRYISIDFAKKDKETTHIVNFYVDEENNFYIL